MIMKNKRVSKIKLPKIGGNEQKWPDDKNENEILNFKLIKLLFFLFLNLSNSTLMTFFIYKDKYYIDFIRYFNKFL